MLYRMKLVEQIGSGIRRIRDACREHGATAPVFEVTPDWVTVRFAREPVTAPPHDTPHEAPHVTPHVERLIAALNGEMSRAQLMDALALADRRHFTSTYLRPALEAGLIEMTAPNSPRSRSQRYRLTASGQRVRASR